MSMEEEFKRWTAKRTIYLLAVIPHLTCSTFRMTSA